MSGNQIWHYILTAIFQFSKLYSFLQVTSPAVFVFFLACILLTIDRTDLFIFKKINKMIYK